jgi:energy-coupling factor transporter ATP-binding protein EcfA2
MTQVESRDAPAIEVRSVSYRYAGAALPVLEDVSLTIHRGDFVAIVGQNGAGKTTLAKMFSGILLPTSGDLLVNGQSICSSEFSRRAPFVGHVYQNPDHQIFAKSVRDEVAFGPRNLEPVMKFAPR